MIQEQVNDPDPLMRLLNFQEIVAEGDRLKTELAVRTAMAIEDPRLRSAAMLAYLGYVDLVPFDWALPSEVETAVKKDSGHVQGALGFVYQDHEGAGGKMPILFENLSEDGSFNVYAMMRLDRKDDQFTGEGRVLGDRLVFRTKVHMARSSAPVCDFDITPTAELELRGTVTCEGYNWGGPMSISAAMF